MPPGKRADFAAGPQIFLTLAHTALRTLVQTFQVEAPSLQEIAQQIPRADNSASDAAANLALDSGSFVQVDANEVATWVHALVQDVLHPTCLLVSFDGAARGNPGPGASGVSAWWGSYDSNGFHAKGMLWQRGVRLGTNTNNVAEAHGLATCLKMMVHFFYWVIENLSQLAAHPVR